MGVVAGFAGLEGFDLAAVDLVDDARLGGMALKKGFCFVGIPNNQAGGELGVRFRPRS